MRTLLGGELTTILSSHVSHYLKVEVQDGDGVYKDWSAYVIGANWGESKDQPVQGATITLRRADGSNSLAPLISASPLNVYSGGYAPAIDKGRGVRISTATMPGTTAPVGADYREMFLGRVDDVSWESDPIVVSCSDLGAWLMDTQIEFEMQFGFETKIVTETFTGTTGTNLQSHVGEVGATWTRHTTYANNLQLSNANRLRQNSTGSTVGLYYPSGVPLSPDQELQVTVRLLTNTTNSAGVVARLDTAADNCYLARYNDNTDAWELCKVVAGTVTVLGSFSQSLVLNTNYELKFRLVGSILQIFVDGINRISVSDSTYVSTGRWGVRFSAGAGTDTTSIHLDTLFARAINGAGSGTGTAVETIIQDILNAWQSEKGLPTLYVPTSPSWNIMTYTQDRVKVLEAIRNLALQIGWDLRYKYDSSHVFKLTLYDPNRGNVTVNATIGPTDYTDVQKLNININNVRNVGRVSWADTSGNIGYSEASDATSILHYGRRYLELPKTKNIDSQAEGDTLIQAVISDLKDSGAEQTIEMLYFWPVQLNDRYTFTQNGIHYDQDQTWAITGYQHFFQDGKGMTSLQVAGRVVGAYDTWIKGGQTDDGLLSGLKCPTITLTQVVHGSLAANSMQTSKISIGFAKPVSQYYDHMEFFVLSNTTGDTVGSQVSAIDSPAAFIAAHPGMQYTITPYLVTKAGNKIQGLAQSIVITGTVYLGPTRIILPVGTDLWS